MSESVLVSIIIPAYNVEKYISKCIESVINQTYDNIEIIVINDGSNDATQEILMSFKNDRITVVNQDNHGVSFSRNEGLRIARGKYVLFIDGDDYLSSDFIDYFVNAAEINNSDFVFSTNCITKKSEKDFGTRMELISCQKATEYLLNPDVIVGCWNKLYKREFLVLNNIWFSTDLFYGEGLMFITTVSQRAKNIVVLDCKKYCYRRSNEESATTVFKLEKYINGEKSLIRIKNSFIIDDKSVRSMWLYHISLFYLGGICSVITNHKKKENSSLYKTWISFLRQNLFKVLLAKNVSFRRKSILLIGTAFPSIIANLNKNRRKKIAKNSIQ